MPRRKFDSEALKLRNKLLAWRFRNFGQIKTDTAHIDDRLEDRSNQIATALMSVAKTSEGRARIVEALLEQQGEIAMDRHRGRSL